MNITATYCTRYNGFLLEDADAEVLLDFHSDPDVKQKAERCIERVCEHLVEECDEDGDFQGCETDATTFITKTVKEFFGDVNVTVEFDHVSS